MKLKIHPLFYVLAIYFVVIGKIAIFGGYIISIVVHEYSHIIFAKYRGYNFGNLTLMPYGGRVTGYQYKNNVDGILISLAGPISNILLSICIVSVWWCIPKVYDYTIDLCRSSIALGFVNLIPVYPLDGSQVLFLFSKNKIKMAKIIKYSSYIFGVVFIALTIISIFYDLNITIAIFGIFVIMSTYLDKDRSLYEYIYKTNIKSKNKEDGLKIVDLEIVDTMPIYKLLGKINSNETIVFHIMNKSNVEIATLSEQDLDGIIDNCPIYEQVKNCCFGDKHVNNKL